MSSRSIEQKQRNKAAKKFRRQLPAYIDLIVHIKTRTRCTTATAYKVLLSGAVKVDNKEVGYGIAHRANGEEFKYIDPFIAAADREKITVSMPEELKGGDTI